MNYEYEINKLKSTIDNLQQNFIQAQKNNVPTTAKVDDTANGLEAADGNIDQNTADIEYIAMMTDVDLEEGE